MYPIFFSNDFHSFQKKKTPLEKNLEIFLIKSTVPSQSTVVMGSTTYRHKQVNTMTFILSHRTINEQLQEVLFYFFSFQSSKV